jgi:hypothetical protein
MVNKNHELRELNELLRENWFMASKKIRKIREIRG